MDQSTDRITAARPDSYNGSKPAKEIEEDIARTRVRLSATIEALERELTPNRVLERSAELLRSSIEPAPGSFRDQDRKSTRLNSSHSSISYAVFCLKKKIKTQTLS